MPEERGLYPKMRVLEQTVYLARLHGWAPAAARRNALELLERLGLGERIDDTIESLSLGNQQRAQIAAALVHRPEVLVLDEPFSGLDPMAVETVQGVLADAAASGAPVLFSSHQLDIVERLCDDLVIIADGRIRAAGTGDALRAEHGDRAVGAAHDGRRRLAAQAPGIRVDEFDGGWAVFEAESDAARQAVLAEAVARGEVVTSPASTPRSPRSSRRSCDEHAHDDRAADDARRPTAPRGSSTASRSSRAARSRMRLRSKAFLCSTGVLMLAVLASVVLGSIFGAQESTTKVAVVAGRVRRRRRERGARGRSRHPTRTRPSRCCATARSRRSSRPRHPNRSASP